MDYSEIQKGNPFSAQLTITNSSVTPSAPYDLTGKTVFFAIKTMDDDSDDDELAIVKKTITVHDDPTNGKTTLSLTSDDTNVPLGIYKCDFRIYSTGGVQINSTKFFVKIIDIVTRRISD